MADDFSKTGQNIQSKLDSAKVFTNFPLRDGRKFVRLFFSRDATLPKLVSEGYPH